MPSDCGASGMSGLTVALVRAGKSTFLDLLAGRKTVGEQKGDILFSGVRPTKAFLKRYTGAALRALQSCRRRGVVPAALMTGNGYVSGQQGRSLKGRFGHAGYVEQFDTLLAELTVREMLLYTAELKCSLSESLAKKKRRVDSLLETLALERCSNTLIGDALARGISGGQVSIPAPAVHRSPHT